MSTRNVIEVKFASVKTLGEREFTGHGATFGNTDLGGDVVVKGAFTKSLSAHRANGTWPVMCYAHDPAKVPGRWLDIREDAHGLAVHGVLADTPLGNEVRELLKIEAISGLSIGFRTKQADFDRDGNRRLIELDLAEISIVSMPMNTRAQVSAVKRGDLAHAIGSVRDYETFVRGAFGLSRNGAKRLAGKTWPAFAEAIGAEADEHELTNISDELSQATAIAVLRSAASKIRSL